MLARRKTRTIIGISAFIAVCFFVFYLFRPVSLSSHAERLLNATLSGDGRTLMAYEFPETIVSDSLDANKFDHVWKDLILPRLGGFHRAGPIESEILGNGAEGTAQLKLIDGNGNPVNIDINVDATDSGPKAEVLSKLIFSWVVMNVVDRHKAFSTRLRAEACVVGLKKDRAYLEGMGIRGVSERNVVKGTMEFATWDDLLSRWSHELDSDK